MLLAFKTAVFKVGCHMQQGALVISILGWHLKGVCFMKHYCIEVIKHSVLAEKVDLSINKLGTSLKRCTMSLVDGIVIWAYPPLLFLPIAKCIGSR